MGLACSIMKGPVSRNLLSALPNLLRVPTAHSLAAASGGTSSMAIAGAARALARRGDLYFHLSPRTLAGAGPEAAPAHHVIRSRGQSRPRRPASSTAPRMTTGPDLPPPWTSTSGSVCVSTRRGGETVQPCPPSTAPAALLAFSRPHPPRRPLLQPALRPRLPLRHHLHGSRRRL
jgi:hypothetical protein